MSVFVCVYTSYNLTLLCFYNPPYSFQNVALKYLRAINMILGWLMKALCSHGSCNPSKMAPYIQLNGEECKLHNS